MAIAPLELWHVGTVVADMHKAIDDYTALGAAGVSKIVTFEGKTYDGARQIVVDEAYDVVFLKLAAERGVVELIEPKSKEGPQAELLAQRSGPSHLAYWCHSLVPTTLSFVERGATLVLAPLLPLDVSSRDLAAASLAEILAISATCYLRLPGGLMIELNPIASRDSMTTLWGRDVLALLPQPAVVTRETISMAPR